jgi:hypothetical protein
MWMSCSQSSSQDSETSRPMIWRLGLVAWWGGVGVGRGCLIQRLHSKKGSIKKAEEMSHSAPLPLRMTANSCFVAVCRRRAGPNYRLAKLAPN